MQLQLAVVLTLLAALYFAVLIKLIHDWYVLPDYSHGFLVPLFSGYLLWHKRHEIRSSPVQPSWFGLWLLVPGLLLLLLGLLGAELYLARISFLLVITGIAWLLAGWRYVKILSIPVAILLLAIPVPQVIFYQVTAPLQRLSATFATLMLPFFGVPVLQQGNVIHLPSISLEVAEACSGIRSLLSLATLCVIYGYFAEKSTIKRLILIACSVPIAIAANALRILGTGVLVQYRGADMAMGFFHEFSGLLVFAASVLLLMGLHVLLKRMPVSR